jgi:hypothetical protein
MNKTEVETHRTHCCVLHGCKYSSKDCPVVRRKVVQEAICERCEALGLVGVPDPDDANYDVLTMTEGELRAEVIRLRGSKSSGVAWVPVAKALPRAGLVVLLKTREGDVRVGSYSAAAKAWMVHGQPWWRGDGSVLWWRKLPVGPRLPRKKKGTKS